MKYEYFPKSALGNVYQKRPWVIKLNVSTGSQCVDYRKVSNIRRTKSQNLNASRLIL